MIKKNKLSLFLLAVVMMLSIYYINIPNEEITKPTITETVTTKHPEYATMRLELLENREELISEFVDVLESTSASSDDKNDAYVSMQQMIELTEKEVLAESFVLNLGYLDCFVCNDDKDITVHILNFVDSPEDFEEVCMVLSDVFGKNILVTILSTDI